MNRWRSVTVKRLMPSLLLRPDSLLKETRKNTLEWKERVQRATSLDRWAWKAYVREKIPEESSHEIIEDATRDERKSFSTNMKEFWLDYRDIYTGTVKKHEGVMLHPSCNLRQLWDLTVVGVLFYLLITLPVVLGLEVDDGGPIQGLPIDIIFMIDICLNFFTGVTTDDRHEVMDQKQVAIIYLKFWFWLDLVSSIPYGLFSGYVSGLGSNPGMYSRLLKLVRLVRLLRLLRVGTVFSRFKAWNSSRFSVRTVLKNTVLLALLLHWTACLFFASALVQDLDDDTWLGHDSLAGLDVAEAGALTRYIVSMYWTVMTLSSVGYGDVLPRTHLEQGYAILVMVTGCCMFAFGVVQIANLLSTMAKADNRSRAHIDTMYEYLDAQGAPHELKAEVYAFMQFKRQHTYEFLHEGELMANLPNSLRQDIAFHVHTDVVVQLQHMPLLRGVGDMVIRPLLTCLKTEVFPPGEVVVIEGELGKKMYFARKGTLSVMKKGKHLCDINEGGIFGEVALYTEFGGRTASIISITFVECATLEKADLDRVLIPYPHLMNMVKARAEHLYAQTMAHNDAQLNKEESTFKQNRPLKLDVSNSTHDVAAFEKTTGHHVMSEMAELHDKMKNFGDKMEKLLQLGTAEDYIQESKVRRSTYHQISATEGKVPLDGMERVEDDETMVKRELAEASMHSDANGVESKAESSRKGEHPALPSFRNRREEPIQTIHPVLKDMVLDDWLVDAVEPKRCGEIEVVE